MWKTVGTFNGQMLETYRSVGSIGKSGGNGGSGGVGGKGGLSGCTILNGIIVKIDKGNGE